MRVVIPGGSGHVGTLLARHFQERGDEVVVLSRKAAEVTEPWRVVGWDGVTLGDDWAKEIDGADVVINLAGRSVDCRYDERHRKEILESRVLSTRVVGEAIAAAKKPPRVWLQASTATIYAHRFDAPNDEDGVVGGAEPDAPSEWRFSTDVAKAWESAMDEAVTPSTRKVKLRSAIVMAPARGGAFQHFRGLARHGFGGPQGNGKQLVSWIHAADFCRAIDWILQHREVSGVINLAAPNPLPNRAFMDEIRKACAAPLGLPAYAWMLCIGAFVLRTEVELLLKSRYVVPRRLLDGGFTFEFPTWREAARDLCAAGGREVW